VRLSTLLTKLEGRRLIFLGDYIDHGPNAQGTIEILVETATRQLGSIFLAGNHELGFLAYLSGRLSFLEYAWMGGLPTIRNYIGEARDNVLSEMLAAVPERHRQFLSTCQPYFETEHLMASHAGINPAQPQSRDLADVVLGRHVELFEDGFQTNKLVICGHYLQTSQTPLTHNGVICLDTGCGTIGGPLTALLYPEMTFLQV
jgi:serine/threonine protein phosphatase 1